MTPVRLVICVPLFAIFLWVAIMNWFVFWKGCVRKQKAPSWIPLIGGIAGMASFALTGLPRIQSVAWLPLILDFGSVPGFLFTAAAYVAAVSFNRRRLPSMSDVVTMYRPTSSIELELVAASGWRRWPPRLPGQPIFYPVTNQQYAEQIALEWNVPESGSGFVTRFQVRRSFAEGYETHQVGAEHHTEWWIPLKTWRS